MKRAQPVALPEWFVALRPKSILGSKDVALLFGYASPASLLNAVSKGVFPAPKEQVTFGRQCRSWSGNRSKPCNRHYWTKNEVLQEMARRNPALV
jgi:hypothetical protein